MTMNYEPLTIGRLGAVAQLGEHLVRNEKVGGSNPLCSRNSLKRISGCWLLVDS